MEIAAAGGGGCGSAGASWHLASGFVGTGNPWRHNPGPGNHGEAYKYIEDGGMGTKPAKSGWFGVTATAGSVQCLEYQLSPMKVNENTCAEMADGFESGLENFYAINPELKKNCKKMLPKTRYCVKGFIEPTRAWNGKCGPNHQNATCHGTKKTCCNSETWTCGNTLEDCAPGVCYEGTCHGHSIYSTDGLCGAQHGYRGCAGKWGNCCGAEGKCGSGPGFCGLGCQSGMCEHSPSPSKRLSRDKHGVVKYTKRSPFCGGDNGEVCLGKRGIGACCNIYGHCGDLIKDCAAGCQPKFGKCGAEAFDIPAPYLKQYSTDTLDEISRLEDPTANTASDGGLSHEEL